MHAACSSVHDGVYAACSSAHDSFHAACSSMHDGMHAGVLYRRVSAAVVHRLHTLIGQV